MEKKGVKKKKKEINPQGRVMVMVMMLMMMIAATSKEEDHLWIHGGREKTRIIPWQRELPCARTRKIKM
jgi:hypothetical protein